MPKILFNPTNEVLVAQYVGEEVKIAPGAKVRVDDARGRQVLNHLFPRGLCELEFGDEGAGEIEKGEKGRERNRAFKRKQVMDFNAINDQRTQAKLPFLVPEPFLKAYANELGMKLFEPYSSTDESKREGVELREEIQRKDAIIAQKDKDVEGLRSQVAELTTLVNKVLAAGAGALAADPADEWEELRKQIRGINRNHFANWVKKNFQAIEGYPESIQAEIRDKYERMYGMPYPASAAEAEAVAA